MFSRKYAFLICIFISSLFPISGYSQFFYYYANPFAFASQGTRYTLGANFISVSGEFKGLVPLYSNTGGKLGDTIITRNLRSDLGVGYAIGTTLPIARTGRRSSYDLSIDLHYNGYTFIGVNGGVKQNGADYSSASIFDGTTVTNQLAIPLSIDYKWGSDAIAKRTTRFGFLLGAGGMPQYSSTVGTGFKSPSGLNVFNDKSVFSVTPFVKAEFSAYVVFCFRVKVFYSIGNINLTEGQTISASTGQLVTSTFNAKSSLVISVCTLPLSFLWQKERNSHGWWDDFESEEALWRRN